MKVDTLQQQALRDRLDLAGAQEMDQYTLWQILGIWALVTVPMALLAWVAAPAIIPTSPLHPGITFWLLMIAGMAWQFVVSLAIMYRELGTLRWSAIRRRTWLQTPRDPKTGQPNPRLYWWIVPFLLLNALLALGLSELLDAPMAWLFPALQPPAYTDMAQLANPVFHGQWWLLGVALVSLLFNYFLGEEFLWHGVPLPKMHGVFGRWDWLANAVLFGLYHLHKPWAMIGIIFSTMTFSYPAVRFRSNWMAIAVHGSEGIPVLVITILVILGLVG